MKQLLRMVVLSLVLAVPLIPARAFAASATLSLSPASSSVAQGSEFTVSIYENSGADPVNGVQANLAYPANLLDFVRITSSSAFAIEAQSTGGGGSVKIGRGTLSPVTGSKLVASVRFKAKVSTGTATVSFASGSEVTNASGDNILTGSTGANYSLKAPTPAAVAAPKDTLAPTITNLKTTDTKINSTTITWTTSEPATSEVSYGLSNSYGLVATDPALVTEHKLVLSSALITPATEFHYMVRSVDPSGNAVGSPDGSFKTKGLSLNITVIDQKNKKVEGAKVTFGNNTATTDKQGRATITELPLGRQNGIVEHKGKKTIVSANVVSTDLDKPSSETFKITVSRENTWLVISIIIGLIGGYLVIKKFDFINKHTNWRNSSGRGGSSPPISL